MSTKRYSPAELRALIETFENPMVVLREHSLWLVNEAYLRMLGLPREKVEGESALRFISPHERSLLSAALQRLVEGGPIPTASVRHLVPAAGGRMLKMAIQPQRVALEDGAQGWLLNLIPLTDLPPLLGVAERLMERSARLVTARSEQAVRQATLEVLASAGFLARFLSREGECLFSSGGKPLPEDEVLVKEALSQGHPVFGGMGPDASFHVYVPLGDARQEVLWVEGSELALTHGSVMMLFAKMVGAALSEARLQAESARGKWEMEALAEVARFVARVEPPSAEAFLERLQGLLSAEVVLLHVREEPGTPPVPIACVGLPAVAPAVNAARLGQVLSEAVLGSEPGVLSGEDEGRALKEASGGKLGCGASVRLTRGGQVYGSLQVLRAPDRPFQREDLRLLGTVAELLVTLLEQHRLRAESARQLSETRLLLDLARTTSAVLDTASILDSASDFLVRLLGVSNCAILLYDDQAKVLRGAAASAAHRDFFRGVTIPITSDDLTARAARERRSLAVEDVEKAAGEGIPEFVRALGEKALLALPLTSREELIGVVLVDDTRGPRLFGPSLIELAEATCGQLSMAIANARLYESLWASYAELAATRAEMVKRERFAALGELSAIVAHEVRNPLGVIFNAVASLRRLMPSKGDAAMLLDILAEESDRLNRIVGDLLDYTRPRDPILHPEDLGRVIQDALEAARLQGGPGGQGVSVQIHVEPSIPPVPMDRRLIRQALVNIIVNAIHAMPHGGVVRVNARREPHAGRDFLRIDVTDQGMGIPAELLHRVFEPFFTTKAQGTGLGLAVVKRILEEHRGEIAVEGAQGQGTTFTLRLPFQPPTLP
ncbi:ATP-binding protein [Stigmatella aurantiaca]|uniref:histidine kinase n=1 Tax=Stigmatella aurantiaca (strain DW4/3-1) TaxID=378806 RepID=Q092S3_STIAD|nr:ATP-binding protein [Stigmatella aurantiaca]ADO69442.1 Sensor protein [Stigmatella aurantiaca DW4/3-1]EAU66743.1 histidine kinase [Stigmatella aurantiaca DW4/3-1]